MYRLPESKCDVSAAEALIACGYPAVDPVLPQILEWMQDGTGQLLGYWLRSWRLLVRGLCLTLGESSTAMTTSGSISSF